MKEEAQNPVKTPLFYGVVGSLIATALVAAGAWLATNMVEDAPQAELSASEGFVGDLGYFRGRLDNYSTAAFNIDFNVPSARLITYSVSKPSAGSKPWTGALIRNDSLEFLLIYEHQRAPISKAFIKSLIKAEYNDVNPTTGLVEARRASVVDKSPIRLSGLALRVFWFSLPFLLTLIGIIIFNKLRSRQTERRRRGNVNEANQVAPEEE